MRMYVNVFCMFACVYYICMHVSMAHCIAFNVDATFVVSGSTALIKSQTNHWLVSGSWSC